MSASARAATRTLLRCTSAVIGSPRRRSALPPNATTTRMSLFPERCDQDRLDRMHPILRLLERDVDLGFEDLLGHLHGGQAELLVDIPPDLRLQIVEGRQAVHELHPR